MMFLVTLIGKSSLGREDELTSWTCSTLQLNGTWPKYQDRIKEDVVDIFGRKSKG